MINRNFVIFVLFNFILYPVFAQLIDPHKPDFNSPKLIPNMSLVWNDEFNINGKPNTLHWKYEKGFVRNKELQWYQPANAKCKKGLLIIKAKRQKLKNKTLQ